IFDLELIPSCLINSDLELHEIINLASSLEHLCDSLPSCDLEELEYHSSGSLCLYLFLSFLDCLKLYVLTQLERDSKNLLIGFLAQSAGSSNADALDSPYLFVLIIGTSQSRQHDKSESSPTAVLLDFDTGRISIRQYEMLKSTTLNVLARSQG
ncbi:hypothetical protein Tco_1521269, partial [Tanacetum coccineum]